MADKTRGELRVAVLAGGISDEREISFDSGRNVCAALEEAGYGAVELLDPAVDDFLDRLRAGGFDVAFIALHGRGGEDGQIQSVLEFCGIPYTGSGVIASACAADKAVSKALYERAGIPVARDAVVEDPALADPAQIVAELGSELFVKPAVNGSSYGVSGVHGEEELMPALLRAAEHGGKVLVEERLVGTEITVGVYDAPDALRVLPIVEIRPQEGSEFYDLTVKYSDPTDIHRIPAQIAPADYARAQELACRAHEALGCTGFSRTDFIVTERGPVILETNTIPGMTDTSLYPDEVRHAGMTFADVCARLIDLALGTGAPAHHLADPDVPADLAEARYPQLWGAEPAQIGA